MTNTGKRRLFESQKELKWDGKPILVNNDLTPKQQERRKKCVKTFKQLRASGIKCRLPHDVILKDGQPMAESDIQAALASLSSMDAAKQ